MSSNGPNPPKIESRDEANTTTFSDESAAAVLERPFGGESLSNP